MDGGWKEGGEKPRKPLYQGAGKTKPVVMVGEESPHRYSRGRQLSIVRSPPQPANPS